MYVTLALQIGQVYNIIQYIVLKITKTGFGIGMEIK